MRRYWILAAAGLFLAAAAIFAVAATEPRRAAADDSPGGANLPVVFRPENTPTPSATPTLAPSPTATVVLGCPPGPTPTPAAFGLVNGGFEGCWSTIEQGNQEPAGWELTWIEPGELVWDSRYDEPATAIAEMIHKLKLQLPPNEWPGAPNALILDGEATFKLFSNFNIFASQLYQRVSLPAGSYRLTVPIQIHWQENLDGKDKYTAESGAWVITGATQSGKWVDAVTMGDRQWYSHVVMFTLPEAAEVDVVIRVKSVYRSKKDFFIDGIKLESISAVSDGPFAEYGRGMLISRPRPLEDIPAAEIVVP